MDETEIQNFWERNPCGDFLTGGLSKHGNKYEAFFQEYDEFRYRTESHILTRLDSIDFTNKQCLEIGLGQGADSEQIIRRGAIWSGIDLTAESVNRVRIRFASRGLPFNSIKQGSVLQLPFDNNSFDIVYSHGVLHHVPQIKTANEEIWRVLKPNGLLILMLYAKFSLNYLVSISLIRRIGLIVLYLIRNDSGAIYRQHIDNAREMGLINYLKMDKFIHKNTDGPFNPYSKVYNIFSIKRDFPNFEIIKSKKHFMHAPPLPVKWLPLEGLLGWHLWAQMKPIHK
ncbi:class I SAM-dependent methyltransferase [Acidobacteriota bacterium]